MKKIKEQKYFQRRISCCSDERYTEDYNKLLKFLDDGWKIITIIPIEDNVGSGPFTSELHYILEREN